VFDNVVSLISTEATEHCLSGGELYILALVVLFHDVGNLFGRTGHHEKIGEVYHWARGNDSVAIREKTLVVRAAKAHTGVSQSGSKNTLVEVDESDHFGGKPVALRVIAAILRLADELAEGPQRTTEFFRNTIGYGDSQKFHQYAACTHVSADRSTGRIRLTYEIQLDDFGLPADLTRAKELSDFIAIVLDRVAKLDEERRYTRFYCPQLEVFRQTDVAINFSVAGRLIDFAIRFQLDDLVVPGQTQGESIFETRYPGKCSSPQTVAQSVIQAATNGAVQ
jgi:hypothetical protein